MNIDNNANDDIDSEGDDDYSNNTMYGGGKKEEDLNIVDLDENS